MSNANEQRKGTLSAENDTPSAYANKRALYDVLRANKFNPDPEFPAALARLEDTKGLPTFFPEHLVAIYAIWYSRKGIIDDLVFLAQRLPKGNGSRRYASALVAHCRMYCEWFAEQNENRPEEFMAEVARLCPQSVQEDLIIEGRWDVLFQVWSIRPDVFKRRAEPMHTEALRAGSTWAGSLLDHLSKEPLPAPFLGTSVLTDRERSWLFHLMDGGTLNTLPYPPFTPSQGTAEAFGKLAPGAFGLGVSELLLLAELTVAGADQGETHRLVRMLAHDLKGMDRIAIGRHLASINYPTEKLIRLGDMLRCYARKRQEVSLERMSKKHILAMEEKWIRELWKEQERIPGVIERPKLKEHKQAYEGVHYHIKPIRRGRDLFSEGKKHKQGIFAHLPDMLARRLMVYSLRRVEGDTVTPLLLIELKGSDTMLNRFLLRNGKFPEDLQVVQVRGYQDRSATMQEATVIQEWMRINKLKGTIRTPPAPRRPTP
jgi:hypothetical protein